MIGRYQKRVTSSLRALFSLGEVLTRANWYHLVDCCEISYAFGSYVSVIELFMLYFKGFDLSLLDGFSFYVVSVLSRCDYITKYVPKLMTSSARTMTVTTPCTL